MAKFSNNSKTILAQCDARLQEVCNIAIEIMDFTIISGYRNKKAQDEAVQKGSSRLVYPQSKHNIFPSLAVDIAPCPIDWNDAARFNLLAGIIIAIAHSRGIKLRWGGDWKGNFNLKENKFPDLGHFEIGGNG